MNRILLVALVAACAISAFAQPQPAAKKTISAFTEKMQKIDGFQPLYLNPEDGKIYLEVTGWNKEFLLLASLPAGVGSNAIGLDRNQLGSTKVVRFERAGNKVLLVEPNYDYRALTNNASEKKSVEDSFAKSVIWGFKVEASEGDRVLVDATSFLIRDAHGVANSLNRARQGTYGFDESRSALAFAKGFPKNTEVEATITLTSNAEVGPQIREVTPTANYVTIRERQSFVELPDDGYKPRKFDPRVGTIPISFYDFGTKINEDLEQRWVRRHRLEKKDPTAAISDPVKPIVYYVDNGAPKDIQDALIEGASWWNQAFEAAGFRNAFQVKVLPADADPMDVRYNMINWVHRSTRGWSLGGSISDPRTGEIIKGDVTLDSSRGRQDILLGSGMVPQFLAGGDVCDFGAVADEDSLAAETGDATSMTYQRIRQLAAHEVGHTLGFAHNFAASTYGRGSVMDYPAPVIEIKNGKLDFSNAYAVGIGSYDKFAVTWTYAQFAPGTDEQAALDKIVRDGIAAGMLFLTDQDARPANGADPRATLWDNGSDPVSMLKHEMQVRRIGLDNFGIGSIPVGAPMSELEQRFMPLYLHHRYQLNADIKNLGGVYYTFSVRERSGPVPSQVNEIVPSARQREALAAALETLDVKELTIPDELLRLMPPVAFGMGSSRSELFAKRTTPIFDAVGAAEISAELTYAGLLEPTRAARMIEFNSRDKANPHFREVVDALVGKVWGTPYSASAKEAAIQRGLQSLLVSDLMDLAADANAAPQVRAVATQALRSLLAKTKGTTLGENAAHYQATSDDIERFLARPDAPRKQTQPLATPPGDPIGN
ncbi:MAG: zinc-dependent metalloprotease [Acidobacteria bacterium]|nr:zinc-dependent metalloprotease [Acidobacteriota bacterium]